MKCFVKPSYFPCNKKLQKDALLVIFLKGQYSFLYITTMNYALLAISQVSIQFLHCFVINKVNMH